VAARPAWGWWVTDKPLVTLALLAYNQERFVREAVEGALAQTYQPLEIILSDDCSEDRTLEVMTGLVQAYAGPHQVRIRKSSRNLGIGSHVSEVLAASTGDFVVFAAGDDISAPERVSRLVATWLALDRKADCIFSNVRTIDEHGVLLGQWCKTSDPQHAKSLEEALERQSCWVYGCSAAYARSLYDTFGPIEADVVHEDMVLPFRALLGGGIAYVPECLVDYRRHGNNVFLRGPVETRYTRRMRGERMACNRLAVITSWICDLGTAGREELVTVFGLRRARAHLELEVQLFTQTRWRAGVNIFRELARGLRPRRGARLFLQHVLGVW
jgi:glycosyltransferase involved in cell wall biosynthesis